MASPNLLDLPPEILLAICDQLTLNNGTEDLHGSEIRGLARLGQTCSALHHFIKPLLYRTLTFTSSFPTNPFALQHLVRTLASPHDPATPGPHIESIHIFHTPSRPDQIHPIIPLGQPYSSKILPPSLISDLDALRHRYPIKTANHHNLDWRHPSDWFLTQRTLLGLLLCLAAPSLTKVTFARQWQDCHLNFELPVELPRLREVRVRKHEGFAGRWCEVDDTRALELKHVKALLGRRVERLELSDCYGGIDDGIAQGWANLTSLKLTGCVIDAAGLASLVSAARNLRTFAFVDRSNLNCCSWGDYADQILPSEITSALGSAKNTLQSLEIDISHTLWHYEKAGQPIEQFIDASSFSFPGLKELVINHSSIARSDSRYLVDLVTRCRLLESLTVTRIREIEAEAVSELASAIRCGQLPMLRRVDLVGYENFEGIEGVEIAYCPAVNGQVLTESFEIVGASLSWRSYPAPFGEQEQRS